MPIAAAQNLSNEDVDAFLKSGWFMGWQGDQCLVAWGVAKKSPKPVGGQLQFYVPDFYLEDKSPWVSFAKVALVSKVSLAEGLKPFSDQPRLELNLAEPDKNQFAQAFDKIKSEISSGALAKAVPVVFATADTTMTKAMRAYFVRALLNVKTGAIPYGYLTPTEGVFGATPETLFAFDEKNLELETMALAGTRRGEAKSELLTDKKERHEHDLVIAGLKEKLQSLGDLEIGETEIWDLGVLAHLRTNVKVKLAKGSQASLLFAEAAGLLHPTAALGISPSSKNWKKTLKNFEGPIERERFGAPFGVLVPDGRSVALVAIRNLQWMKDGAVLLGSGCGIVAQSELENEWRELQLKRKSVGQLLAL